MKLSIAAIELLSFVTSSFCRAVWVGIFATLATRAKGSGDFIKVAKLHKEKKTKS